MMYKVTLLLLFEIRVDTSRVINQEIRTASHPSLKRSITITFPRAIRIPNHRRLCKSACPPNTEKRNIVVQRSTLSMNGLIIRRRIGLTS
jgi:hypothetical protein